MEIVMKDAAVTKILEEIAAEYKANFPSGYREFLECVREEEKQLIKPSAMSAGGRMLNFMKLPEHVYAFVKWQMRKRCGIPDFFASAKNYRLLARVWSDCRIRRKPTPWLDLARTKKE